MAASFSVVSQTRELQVLGPTRVLDVEKVGIITRPTGIYVEFPIPLPVWRDDHGASLLGSLAEQIENIIASGLAVGGEYANDFDNNGLLVDYLDFRVEFVPPAGHGAPMYTDVRVKLDSLLAATDPWFVSLGASPQSLLSEAYDTLVATAAL